MYFKKRNMKKYKSIDLYNRPVKTTFNILKWLFLFIVMTVLVMYVGFKNYANDYETLDLLIYTSIISIALFRSEEHTSELQSRFDLVCRLLLEKKKKYN